MNGIKISLDIVVGNEMGTSGSMPTSYNNIISEVGSNMISEIGDKYIVTEYLYKYVVSEIGDNIISELSKTIITEL